MAKKDEKKSGGKKAPDKMCKLASKGKIGKAAKLAKGAKFICKKCARATADKDNLCSPEKI